MHCLSLLGMRRYSCCWRRASDTYDIFPSQSDVFHFRLHFVRTRRRRNELSKGCYGCKRPILYSFHTITLIVVLLEYPCLLSHEVTRIKELRSPACYTYEKGIDSVSVSDSPTRPVPQPASKILSSPVPLEGISWRTASTAL